MDNEKNYGYLEITVLSGIVISPIKDAIVNIYGDDASIIQSGITNSAGFAGPFRLSAFDENYNDPEIGTRPVKNYMIEINAEGYYKKIKQNIPIFPDIVSIEYVNMLPSPDTDGKLQIVFDDTLYSGSVAKNDNGRDI